MKLSSRLTVLLLIIAQLLFGWAHASWLPKSLSGETHTEHQIEAAVVHKDCHQSGADSACLLHCANGAIVISQIHSTTTLKVETCEYASPVSEPYRSHPVELELRPPR